MSERKWHWEHNWRKDNIDSVYDGGVGRLMDDNGNDVLWYGMDGEENIYCPTEEHAVLIASAPQLLEACQAGLLCINEILAKVVQPVLIIAGLPPIPSPPLDEIRNIIRTAGGVVYETVQEAQAAIAAAEVKK